MDYYEIGTRVRKFRLMNGLSQEQLAEMVDISVTHMSHIETGNTKLSLPVFVALANALGVRTDQLLHDPAPNHDSVLRDLTTLLDTCTAQQARCIADIARATKQAFDQHL